MAKMTKFKTPRYPWFGHRRIALVFY